ncbi:5-oxoprolinase subunit B family protein [Pseudonocardia alaniniphila]|uniref:Allophanate hydrolase subunit 1 n=1 Tax=Pseudonocardia alaniniphila TaxID=75291 RepID=A0ABS9TAL7_9PSEU|nr:carboxyltransferase domain-containing protein [Pseudonocardia alaniniphila]MCH6165571.1 allophanate hydrolase subunit 1 [Pseudonocardia alaniniphila]
MSDDVVFRPLGDMALSVEFGDRIELALNFRVLALDRALTGTGTPGVRETVRTHRSLGVVYDPAVIRRRDMERLITDLVAGLAELTEFPSRLVTIPVWYDDPWSQACARAHGVDNNIDYLAQTNGISREEVINRHAGVRHWVSAVGFQPSTYQAVPLGPMGLTGPKYERPRQWTDPGIVCLAGTITSYYPVRSPGGYQLLGRTPIDLFDPLQRTPAFADSPVLPRVGDRHRYVPIDGAEYAEIRAHVVAGDYEHEIEDGVQRLERIDA